MLQSERGPWRNIVTVHVLAATPLQIQATVTHPLDCVMSSSVLTSRSSNALSLLYLPVSLSDRLGGICENPDSLCSRRSSRSFST